MFTVPVVHLTKHIAAGMIQLRWRLPGTQKYFEFDKEQDLMMSIVKNNVDLGYDIFYFEAKRISLNTDYSLFFNARKKYKSSLSLSKDALNLKNRSK